MASTRQGDRRGAYHSTLRGRRLGRHSQLKTTNRTKKVKATKRTKTKPAQTIAAEPTQTITFEPTVVEPAATESPEQEETIEPTESELTKVEPIEPIEPINPIKPIEPIEPIESTETKAADPTESGVAASPANPATPPEKTSPPRAPNVQQPDFIVSVHDSVIIDTAAKQQFVTTDQYADWRFGSLGVSRALHAATRLASKRTRDTPLGKYHSSVAQLDGTMLKTVVGAVFERSCGGHTCNNRRCPAHRETQILAWIRQNPANNIVCLPIFEKHRQQTSILVFTRRQMDLFEHIVRVNRPLGLDEIHGIVGPLFRGVQQLHAIGVFHGDIKPENVVVCLDGDGKVLTVELIDLDQAVMVSDLGILWDGRDRLRAEAICREGSPSYLDLEPILFADYRIGTASRQQLLDLLVSRDFCNLAMTCIPMYARSFPSCVPPNEKCRVYGIEVLRGCRGYDQGLEMMRVAFGHMHNSCITCRAHMGAPRNETLERLVFGVLGATAGTGRRADFFVEFLNSAVSNQVA
jgi:hypothetical protein